MWGHSLEGTVLWQEQKHGLAAGKTSMMSVELYDCFSKPLSKSAVKMWCHFLTTLFILQPNIYLRILTLKFKEEGKKPPCLQLFPSHPLRKVSLLWQRAEGKVHNITCAHTYQFQNLNCHSLAKVINTVICLGWKARNIIGLLGNRQKICLENKQ